jgi:D-alanine-D-alanine ligase
MKVALLANLKHNAPTWPAMPPGQWDHLETWSTIDALTLALNQGGHYVIFLEGDETLYNNLQAVKPDICFNLCQGHFGEARKTYVPGILEMLHLPYTGSQTFTLALNKSTTKRFLIHHGLPTPPFVVLERAEELVDIELELPVLVQSLRAELYSKTKQVHLIQKRSDFEAHTQYLLEIYQQPVLAEKFIEGREITLGIVGNLSSPVARRLPPNQQSQTIGQGLHILPAVERFISLEQLGQSLQPSICPADLPEAQLEELKWLAAAAVRVIGCLDVAQSTFRSWSRGIRSKTESRTRPSAQSGSSTMRHAWRSSSAARSRSLSVRRRRC